MFEQYYSNESLIIFFIVLIVGVILTFLLNKMISGNASPVTLKKEMEEYQSKVDTHFVETSKKFKQMTDQYQDLYQHLAAGATTLCSPGADAAKLVEDLSSLSKPAIEQKPSSDKATEQSKEPLAKEAPSAKLGKPSEKPVEPSAKSEPSAKPAETKK